MRPLSSLAGLTMDAILADRTNLRALDDAAAEASMLGLTLDAILAARTNLRALDDAAAEASMLVPAGHTNTLTFHDESLAEEQLLGMLDKAAKRWPTG